MCWGVLKWAMSLDGRTALPSGASQWISSSKSRRWVHQLRSQCDAVIVGGGTVRLDDPLLTSRGRRTPEPLRVVLSRSLDLPHEAQIWDASVAPTLLAHGPEAAGRQVPHGAESLPLAVCDPLHLMAALAARGCNRVLWECGPTLAAAALRQGCIQELTAVVAPKLLGGASARTPLADLGFERMDEVNELASISCRALDCDWLIQGRLLD